MVLIRTYSFVVEVQEESGEWVVSKGVILEKKMIPTRMGFEPTRGRPQME